VDAASGSQTIVARPSAASLGARVARVLSEAATVAGCVGARIFSAKPQIPMEKLAANSHAPRRSPANRLRHERPGPLGVALGKRVSDVDIHLPVRAAVAASLWIGLSIATSAKG
jgi:hypothetical protein